MSYDEKLDRLTRAERETRDAISFADSLEDIEKSMQEHKKAVRELNQYLKSIWRVKND